MTEQGQVAAPSTWVVRWLTGCAGRGRLLDLACGSGRHVRLAQELGFDVVAVDRDPAVLAALPGEAVSVVADLESDQAPDEFFVPNASRFAVVLVTNYLYRPFLDHVLACVAPGGLLIYETFASGNAEYGRPSNPDFLLQPRELLERLNTNWHVLAYEDGIRSGKARVQRVAAIQCAGLPAAPMLASHLVEPA